MVNTLAIPDDLQHIASQGEEDWDPAYVIHLYPVATLRNLLPYTVRYMMEVHQLPQNQTEAKAIQRSIIFKKENVDLLFIYQGQVN